jgi:hypothetical protein
LQVGSGGRCHAAQHSHCFTKPNCCLKAPDPTSLMMDGPKRSVQFRNTQPSG